MGDPNNMAGTIINKLTLHDNIILNHTNKDTVHDISINLLEQNVQKNFEDISQNRIDIVANNNTLANALQLTDIQVNNNEILLSGQNDFEGFEIDIPGDFSSAAFLIVGALISPNS